MSKATETPKPLYAVRNFRDAGIEKDFAAGDDLSGEPGVGNYAAAGLVSDVKRDERSQLEAVLG